MRVLVTGASGFLGGHLVEALVKSKHQVAALVRERSDTHFLDHLGVELRKGDLTDPMSLERAVKGVDAVVHLAAYYTFSGKKELYQRINLQGTKYLLEAMLVNNVRRLVYCSSTEAIGPTKNGAADESSPCHPYYEYGRSKLEVEQHIQRSASRGIDYTIIRPSGIYGPRNIDDVSYWFITSFANSVASKMIIGDGKKVLMFVHVEDVVQGFVQALQRPQVSIGQTYIVSDVRAYSYEEIYAIMAKIFHKEPPKRHIPVWLAKVMVAPVQGFNYLRRKPNFIWRISTMDTFKFDRNYSIAKARQELGYEPQHALPEGLKETADWYREEGYIKG